MEDDALMGRRQRPQDGPVVGPSCVGCRYVGYFCSQSAYKEIPEFCEYILITGHRRPCPAGPGCTARKEGGRKRRRTEE